MYGDDLLQDNGFISDYKMIGMHICMGDHKVSWFDCHSRLMQMIIIIKHY